MTLESFDELRLLVDPGPLGDVQVVHKVDADLHGADMPRSKSTWTPPSDDSAPCATAPSTGSFFWVRHDFIPGKSETFWARLSDQLALTYQPGFASPHPDRVHCHCLLPTGKGELDPIFSVWETRDPMHVHDFRWFLLGQNSPVLPDCVASAVHQVPSSANPLSAAFRARASFLSSAMMPLEDPMAKIAAVMPMRIVEPKKTQGQSWLKRPDWLESY